MDVYIPPTLILNRVLAKRETEFVCLVHSQLNDSPFVVRGIYLHFLNQTQLNVLSRMKEFIERIRHPTLIQHFEINRGLANRYLIYSEYCELGSLESEFTHCKEDGEYIDELIIWEYITQLVDLTLFIAKHIKIEEMDKHFFLYRFFKPSNIFLYPNGCIKTGDYGLFAPPTRHTETFQVGAWINYIAPEVFRGKTAHLQSAMFSLGCLLYSLCTLTDISLFKVHETEVELPRVSPSLVIPAQYSTTLRNVMHDMLKLNPNDRITFQQLAQKKPIEEARYRVRAKQGAEGGIATFECDLVATRHKSSAGLAEDVTEAEPKGMEDNDTDTTSLARRQPTSTSSTTRRMLVNPVITECGIHNPRKQQLCFLRTAGMPKKYIPKYKSTTNVLHYAASTRNLELLERRLDFVGGFDDEGRTALMICVEISFMKGFLILMEYEARKRCKRIYKYENVISMYPNALTIASIRGYLDFVKHLYDRESADVNPDGLTPLMCAAINNKVDVVKFLVMKQSRMRSAGGKTALMHAAEHGNAQCVETLCAWEIGLQDENGMTALMLSAIHGHLACVHKLCNMEGNTRNNNNLLAIDLVNAKRYPQIYKVLYEVEG